MIGIVIVIHQSKFRPNGFEFVNNCIESLYKFLKKDFILYLFDNASVEKYNVPNYPNIKYEYIKDQTIRGLVGPVNDGVDKAVEDGCDIIILANDDIIINETVNDFIDIIENHEHKDIGLYGPLTNGCLKSSHQYAEKVGKGILELTNEDTKAKAIIRGFFMTFTKEFVKKFRRPNGKFLNEDKLWRGGEVSQLHYIRPLGGRLFVIKDCWIFHYATHGILKRLRILNRRKKRK